METSEQERQREITRLCVQTALLLLQNGAESTVVVQMAKRLGAALGVDSVECALTANAVILTTVKNENCITTTRQNIAHSINMYVVTKVQHIVIATEQQVYDINQVRIRLSKITPFKYNRHLVTLMVGLSCASFAHLSGGDITICLITLLSAICAMYARQYLTAQHYNASIVFSITAFIASLIAGIALKYHIGNDPHIALASSVLLLVPGFPFINSLADILKGYVNMGIGRWAVATILTLSACIGIVFAITLLNISSWRG